MGNRLDIGIDIGGTFIKYGLVDAGGKVVFKSGQPTPTGERAILDYLITAIAELNKYAKSAGRSVSTVGIGSAGIVDSMRGVIIGRCHNVVGLEGVNVKEAVEAETGLPTYVDNDANAMALAEHRFGAGKGTSSGLYITVGTGIGSGIILNNRLWRGSGFAGAEVGHVIIRQGGRKCGCGKHGCLEAYAGTESFWRYYGTGQQGRRAIKQLFKLAADGDRKAVAAIEKAADFLACGIGSVLEVLNPQVVVIGGGIAAGRGYVKAVRKSLPGYCSGAVLRNSRILRARLGNDAGLTGAALLHTEMH